MLTNLILLAHIIVSVLLVLVILLQRSDGGLGALGGSGADSMMSSRGSANGMTKATTILATLFIILSLASAVNLKGAGRDASVLDTAIIADETPSDINTPVVPQTIPSSTKLEGEDAAK